MKTLISVTLLALGLLAGNAYAEDKAPTKQQSKMTTCNKEAGDKKGDERKAFMKDCLSAKPAAAADKKTAQQEKMKTCNKDATGKTGDARKAFMKECLSK
jgi:hypothetical protein